MPRNKYPEETVQKILDTALILFLEKGYENTTVLDIVGNLGGLTRGAFYHHFDSKEEVMHALMSRVFYRYEVFESVKHAEGLSGLDKIKMVLRKRAEDGLSGLDTIKKTLKRKHDGKLNDGDEVCNNGDVVAVPSSVASLCSNPRFMVEHVRSIQRASRALDPLIAEGMADGSIRPGNSKVLSELMLLLLNFWLPRTVYPGDKQEIIDKLAATKQILDGFGFPVIDDVLQEKLSRIVDDLESINKIRFPTPL
jgi:AcrR family transcriptional regulator